MVKGELKRMYYRAIGQQMMMDTLSVDFEVDGETYTHQIPNKGWGYDNPSLQFFGYVDIKPTDIDGTEYVLDEKMMCPVKKSRGGYDLAKSAFEVGKYLLQEAEWFNPEGNVWNSGESQAFGGMSVDPSTGNRAAVDGEDERMY